jgi:predicted metalloprotease
MNKTLKILNHHSQSIKKLTREDKKNARNTQKFEIQKEKEVKPAMKGSYGGDWSYREREREFRFGTVKPLEIYFAIMIEKKQDK